MACLGHGIGISFMDRLGHVDKIEMKVRTETA